MVDTEWDPEAAAPLLPKQYDTAAATAATMRLHFDVLEPATCDRYEHVPLLPALQHLPAKLTRPNTPQLLENAFLSTPWLSRPEARIMLTAWVLLLVMVVALLTRVSIVPAGAQGAVSYARETLAKAVPFNPLQQRPWSK